MVVKNIPGAQITVGHHSLPRLEGPWHLGGFLLALTFAFALPSLGRHLLAATGGPLAILVTCIGTEELENDPKNPEDDTTDRGIGLPPTRTEGRAEKALAGPHHRIIDPPARPGQPHILPSSLARHLSAKFASQTCRAHSTLIFLVTRSKRKYLLTRLVITLSQRLSPHIGVSIKRFGTLWRSSETILKSLKGTLHVEKDSPCLTRQN